MNSPPRISNAWLICVVGFVLVSFVSPFSYLPNPLGFYYMLAGYGYTADSLFVNRFATLIGDPARAILSKLDALIGQTGLDPLDPNHPLIAYHVRRVVSQPHGWRWLDTNHAVVEVEFRYADGAARVYEIPVYQRYRPNGGTVTWRYTGLDRLFAPHEELLKLPFSDADAPIHLNTPERLDLSPEARRLGTGSLGGWYLSTTREGEEIRWAPDERRFLLRTSAPDVPDTQADDQPLWLISLDGSSPQRVAPNRVLSYEWSADGEQIVYLRLLRWLSPATPRIAIVAFDPNTGAEHYLAESATSQISIVGEFVYFLNDEVLWRKPLDDRPVERLRLLPDSAPALAAPSALAVSPDGERVAYRCGTDVCISDVSGANVVRVSLGYPPVKPTPARPSLPIHGPAPTPLPADVQRSEPRLDWLHLVWSHDGERLAIVAESPEYGSDRERLPELWIVDRAGRTQRKLAVGVDGTAREPQWTTDDRFIFLNTFPSGGRRIVAVEVATGRIWDLSQPRWDAFASLAPDGKHLLLWNGRGGFWIAELDARPSR